VSFFFFLINLGKVGFLSVFYFFLGPLKKIKFFNKFCHM
jgi:hypothetical protein